MSLLPTYQSQLLLFQQAFQRGDFAVEFGSNDNSKNQLPTTPNKTTALSDPAKRLQHYQLADLRFDLFKRFAIVPFTT